MYLFFEISYRVEDNANFIYILSPLFYQIQNCALLTKEKQTYKSGDLGDQGARVILQVVEDLNNLQELKNKSGDNLFKGQRHVATTQ